MPFDITIRQEMGWHLIYPSAPRWVPKVAAFRDWILQEVKV